LVNNAGRFIAGKNYDSGLQKAKGALSTGAGAFVGGKDHLNGGILGAAVGAIGSGLGIGTLVGHIQGRNEQNLQNTQAKRRQIYDLWRSGAEVDKDGNFRYLDEMASARSKMDKGRQVESFMNFEAKAASVYENFNSQVAIDAHERRASNSRYRKLGAREYKSWRKVNKNAPSRQQVAPQDIFNSYFGPEEVMPRIEEVTTPARISGAKNSNEGE
jgi:hypothetical protein